ncbi:hypothetical protein D3C72_1806800 [compost metagenome]
MKIRYAYIAIALAGVSSIAAAQSREILIMGGQSQDTFLGRLTCNEYASNSVWNEHSPHGWSNKYGTWNRYGQHASEYASHSACNPYSSSAPALVDRQGNFYGRLSTNEYAAGSICGAQGAPQICRALRVMCADS